MCTELAFESLPANEAACITGIPLGQVHRIVDKRRSDSADERRGDRDMTIRMPVKPFDCVCRQGASRLRIGG